MQVKEARRSKRVAAPVFSYDKNKKKKNKFGKHRVLLVDNCPVAAKAEPRKAPAIFSSFFSSSPLSSWVLLYDVWRPFQTSVTCKLMRVC